MTFSPLFAVYIVVRTTNGRTHFATSSITQAQPGGPSLEVASRPERSSGRVYNRSRCASMRGGV